MLRDFIPKSYLCFRQGYTAALFRKDLLSGITIGVIALPLAMAFAIASGTTPERGLITAIIAGFIISALGGSRVQIGGPTGAFVVIIYDIIHRTGYEGLAISTLIGAALLVLFGLLKLGSWIKYVPNSLVVGFTAGIAVLIFSSQIKDFLGLNMGLPPAPFIDKWKAYFGALSSLHSPTLLLSSSTLILILVLRRFLPKLPWGIVAIALATLVSAFFSLPIETIQTKFGGISSQLPLPAFPSFSLLEDRWWELCTDGFTIAFLAGIESLLSAVIGDTMIGGAHKSNCELVGQGIANFASILFGGIPATGAIARTAANAKMGGQTPVAGMVHAVTLFAIALFLGPVVNQIPLAALAAVLIMVSWNMCEIDHFIGLLRTSWREAAVLLTAFLLTLFGDITIAITCGMALAFFLLPRKAASDSLD